MAENDLEALRVRLQPVAEDGRPGASNLGPHLAALAASRVSATADDEVPGTTQPRKNAGPVPDEPSRDSRGDLPRVTGHRPVAADGPPPVAPGPSVRSLMIPRTRWDEEPPADVVPMPKRSAEDRGREDPPRRVGIVALLQTPGPEDVGGQSDDERDAQGATSLVIHQPEGREDSGFRVTRSRRSSGARRIGIPKLRRSAALIAAATIVGILTVAAASLVRGTDVPDQASPPPTPALAADLDVRMVIWRGMDVPVSGVAGPFAMGETHVSGFARTELGAAVAAAHLSVRLDPAAGPPTFEAVLEDQVVGDVDRMAAAVRDQYRAEATREQQAARQPLPVTPGRLVGWRTDGDLDAGAVTVHLAVRAPAGALSDFAVPLRWTRGDWSVDAAESGPFFPVTAVSGEYRAFATGEAM